METLSHQRLIGYFCCAGPSLGFCGLPLEFSILSYVCVKSVPSTDHPPCPVPSPFLCCFLLYFLSALLLDDKMREQEEYGLGGRGD